MQLRYYQQEIIEKTTELWNAGTQNVLGQLSTGGGKTVILSTLVKQHNGYSIVIAHRTELVSQLSLTLAKFGILHNIIAPKQTIREIVATHHVEHNRGFYDPTATCFIASVDTLIRLPQNTPWFKRVTLLIVDESHHVLKPPNKWGKACNLFPNARGFFPTATPVRADGKGLGRHSDGLMDALIVGVPMRQLIKDGHLCDYKIYAPPNDLDLSNVHRSASGDFSPVPLRSAVHKSKITGDIVEHYLRFAKGKRGVTFAVDIKAAADIALEFKLSGVPAEVVSSLTPPIQRQQIMRKFRDGELLQLVNVDILGEGVDVPAIEVVSMGRPTESYSVYCLDPETEILTPNGWKNADTLPEEQKIFGFDIESEEISVQPITGFIKRALYPDERMYGIDSPHLDILVSDKHNLCVKGRAVTCRRWILENAEITAERKSLFKIPVSAEMKHEGANLSTPELEFLGWFLSDGTINKKSNSLSISQSSAKIHHVFLIEDCLKKCGLKYAKRIYVRKNVPGTHNNLIIFNISKGKPRIKDKHLKGWEYLSNWLDKKVPKCYDSLTKEQLLILLGTLNLGDGVNNHASLDYYKKTLTITCGTNYEMADRIQVLCVLRGLRCNIAYPHYKGRSKWAVLHIRDTSYATIAGTNVKNGKILGKSYNRSRLEAKDIQPEYVYCVSNPLETLITRRNGKVAIVGNCQQFGRALRPLPGKTHAIIIDHVNNYVRHGLPDAPRRWSLEPKEKRSRGQPEDTIPLKTCLECLSVYTRFLRECPYCGHYNQPQQRSSPEFVDGDLLELDSETLARLRGEAEQLITKPPKYPQGVEAYVIKGIQNRHAEKIRMQQQLRETIAQWAGIYKHQGCSDSEIYRRFYHAFNIDILTAQTLGTSDANMLYSKVVDHMENSI